MRRLLVIIASKSRSDQSRFDQARVRQNGRMIYIGQVCSRCKIACMLASAPWIASTRRVQENFLRSVFRQRGRVPTLDLSMESGGPWSPRAVSTIRMLLHRPIAKYTWQLSGFPILLVSYVRCVPGLGGGLSSSTRSPQAACGTKRRLLMLSPCRRTLWLSPRQPSCEFSSPAPTTTVIFHCSHQASSTVSRPHSVVRSDDAACHRVTGIFGVVAGPLSLTLIPPKREATGTRQLLHRFPCLQNRPDCLLRPIQPHGRDLRVDPPPPILVGF